MASFVNSRKYDGVQYYIKADKTKSYYVRYKDASGILKRVKIGDETDGTTEHYCKNKRIEIMNTISKGEQPPKFVKQHRKKMPTLNDVSRKYFDSKEKTRSTGDRQSKYNKHLSPEIGEKPIHLINKSDLENIKQRMVKKKGLSDKTVNMVIELFSTIFNYGFKNELYEYTNPATKVERFRIKNTRERYLRANELDELYREAAEADKEKANGNMLELFVKLAATTGGRMEGILNIKKSDIDLQSDIIRITDFKSGNEVYSAYIGKSIKELLSDALQKMAFNDYVVSFNYSGKKTGARQLQTRLKPILDKLFNTGQDIKDRKNRIVIHSLRHTFASLLATSDVPLKQIQELMNHSDIKETVKYAKLQDNSNKRAAQSVF